MEYVFFVVAVMLIHEKSEKTISKKFLFHWLNCRTESKQRKTSKGSLTSSGKICHRERVRERKKERKKERDKQTDIEREIKQNITKQEIKFFGACKKISCKYSIKMF